MTPATVIPGALGPVYDPMTMAGSDQEDDTAAGLMLPLVVLIGIFLAGAAAILFTVSIRAGYGVWTVADTPERVGFCALTYTLFDHEPRSKVAAIRRDPAAASSIVVEPTIGNLPIGAPQPSQFELGAGYNGCGNLILLHTGADEYLMYYKLDGP